MTTVVTVITVLGYGASLCVVLLVLQERREPVSMLAWVLLMLLLPVFGPLIYFLMGQPRIRRRRRDRQQPSKTVEMRRELLEAITGRASAKSVDTDTSTLLAASARYGSLPVTTGNLVKVLEDSQDTYAEILSSIDTARHHVHLQYYIFRPDETGTLFRDRLVKKAESGVRVRVLVDGVGSWGTPERFFKPLINAGGDVSTFLPAIPLRRKWNVNFRNHRKIVVIDRTTAYMGSQNIGDEYRGRWRRVAPWKDTHLRIDGPAALQLQTVFLDDWRYATDENVATEEYFGDVEPQGSSLVQIIPSGVDEEHDLLEEFSFVAISSARRNVRVSTPYFVPNPGILLALKTAARRGIEVELLIPTKTDSILVLWAGRSYYEELLEAGVKIYEHHETMLHSKVITIDDQWSLVGSANMDVRSFSLNFEVTASIFDSTICEHLNESFRSECRDAFPRTFTPENRRRFARAVLEGAARLFSPLL